jgi:putative ABC transport system permease protein
MLRTLLRWSWRDLRARWVQVAAIAAILAVGTGTIAAFDSMIRWREQSNAASYAITNVHDLRGRLGAGAYLPAGTLSNAVWQIAHADAIEAVEERLIVPTQVDASSAQQDILVRGRIIGMDLTAGGPFVNTPHAERGRMLTAADTGADVVALEYNFARYYDLPASGQISLAGERTVEYVGQVTHPEYFLVILGEGGFFGQQDFAAVFTSLETAGRLAGQPGAVNDVVVRLAGGADRDLVKAELAERLASLGATVITIDDDPSYTTVVRDVEGDQDTTRVISLAVLLGAVFAAFNLTSRMVDAQRREIGVGMALGVPRWLIAIRPLLVGLQIALLGVVLGVGFGYLIGLGIRDLLESTIPTPVIETPFQFDIYARAAILGIVAPLAAISLPVWLAVRVAPVDAIRTGHLAVRGRGLGPLVRLLPIPGGSLGRMPVRNLLRAPRRTLLTAIAIAASLTVLVGILVVLDAIIDAADRSRDHLVARYPERMIVDLDNIYALDSPQYEAVAGSPALARTEPVTRIIATLLDDRRQIDVFLDFIDFGSDLWQPALSSGALDPSAPGLVLAKKAAQDLGVAVGDMIGLRLMIRDGDAFRVVERELPLLGLHGNAFRTFAYIDRSHLDVAGLQGMANQVIGLPAAGYSETDVKRAMLPLPNVGSALSAESVGDVFGDFIDEVATLFYILVAAAVALAGLIAFNSASISADERRREHATMFAYGVPPSRVLRVTVVESLLLGIAATALGLLGGLAFAQWMLEVILARTMPDLGANVTVTLTTALTAVILGVVAVGLAPVFTFRKMRRMDIPSTLRVME